MFTHLLIVAGPDQGQKIPLPQGQPLLLGRGRQVEMPLTDLRVSRAHCQVQVEGARVVVTDRGSTGGTFINGLRVESAALRPGDILQIGDTQLRLYSDVVADMATLAPDIVEAQPFDPSSEERALGPEDGPAALTPPPTPAAAEPSRLPLLSADRLGELTGLTLAHFEVGPMMARGQSGIVFRARDTRDDRTVALKVLRPEFARSQQEVQRFIRAMRTVLPFRHDNLVTLYGAGKKGPYCWISMELVEGESLTQVIQRIGVAGMLDWRHAYRVAVHLARALEFAHGRHVIHRNLTPQNVLVRDADRVTKLGDLMLAKALEGGLAENLTRPGEILGDVRYMSPERTLGSDAVDERSDIYSLGALVYALLTGRAPIEGSSLIETLTQIRSVTPEKPRKFQMSIPDRFESIVLTMLAKRPEDRFPTAAKLREALEAVGKYQGITV
jgi:hypothetical protein